MNAMANAMDAAEERGNVTLRTHVTGADCYFRVTDDVPGVPLELGERGLATLFTTRQVGPGTASHRPSTYLLVREHRGTLEVRGGPGRGACIAIRIPNLQEAP